MHFEFKVVLAPYIRFKTSCIHLIYFGKDNQALVHTSFSKTVTTLQNEQYYIKRVLVAYHLLPGVIIYFFFNAIDSQDHKRKIGGS